eukprot:scaffold131695_cov69-Phaeocystis_antarctica.AAC.3
MRSPLAAYERRRSSSPDTSSVLVLPTAPCERAAASPHHAPPERSPATEYTCRRGAEGTPRSRLSALSVVSSARGRWKGGATRSSADTFAARQLCTQNVQGAEGAEGADSADSAESVRS